MANVFTDEDLLFPVYCTACKAHTPKADSDAGLGLCADCVAKAAKDAAQAQSQAAADQARAAHARYHTDTGMGACDKCQSKNIRQFDVHDSRSANNAGTAVGGAAVAGTYATATGAAAAAPVALSGCLIAALIGIIFLPCVVLMFIFAAPFLLIGLAVLGVLGVAVAALLAALMTKKKVGTSRECLNCGHRWPV